MDAMSVAAYRSRFRHAVGESARAGAILSMRSKSYLLAAWIAGSGIGTLTAQTLAFPGAEGFGRFATGGRGGTVYHVTNLNDSGPGSFRDAVSVSGRTVVFDVGGVIDYRSPRYAPAPNVTIAGQTAPGDGITIYGNGLSFSGSHNAIVRFIRVRQGINGNSGADAVGIANGHDMIFDHLSVSWGRDETFSVNGDVDNITIQNTIISQGLQTHSAGGLIQTDGGVSILRSLYIDNDTRNPKVKFVNEFVNNVVCNWENIGYNMGGDSAGDSYVNMIGNYFIRSTASSSTAIGGGNSSFHIYAADNWLDSNRNGILDGSLLPFSSYGSMDRQTVPYPYPIVNSVTPLTALKIVINEVGASLLRDEVDELLMDELTSWGTEGGTISSEFQLPTAGPGIVRNGTPYPDTDHDGMPDYWEKGTGSNPNIASNNDPSPNGGGYTRLEDYLNWLVEPHGIALPDEVVAVDLRQFARGFEAVGRSPVYSVKEAHGGDVSITDDHFVRFVPDAGLEGMAGFSFSVIDSDGSEVTRPFQLFFTPDAQAHVSIWRGNHGENLWDVVGANNWFDDRSLLHQFENGDSVMLDDSGAAEYPVRLTGSLEPASVHVEADEDYTFTGEGSLDGAMTFRKSGVGSLRLETDNGYSGATTVDGGALLLQGTLANSPVTVEAGGSVGGTGTFAAGLTVEDGGVLLGGDGLGRPGTTTVLGGLSLEGGATGRFDISDDPTGVDKANDHVHIEGDLMLSGVSEIKISLLDGLAGDGTYKLITFTGTLTGGLDNLSLVGVNGELAISDGAIVIDVTSERPPANLVWNGNAPADTWDTGNRSNWLNDAVADRFYFLDTAIFDDSGADAPDVTIEGSITPGEVIVDADADYSIGGGILLGTGGLAKSGSGILTLGSFNEFTGATVINGGTIATSRIGNGGSPSGIGASSASAANLVFDGGGLHYSGGITSTDRDATLRGDGVVDVSGGRSRLTWNGSFAGPGRLIKEGNAPLIITGQNAHSGGTEFRDGVLALDGADARDGGLGTGPAIFNGGTLRLWGNDESTSNDYGTFDHPLHVPEGAEGTLLTPPRYNMASTLTGSGTLNLQVDYLRGRLAGNWSAFTGTINVTALNSNSDESEFRIANASMFSSATVILNDDVLMDRNGGSSVISIGALGGTAGSRVGRGNSSSGGTTYRVGGNDGDATFRGSFENDGTTTVVKEGSGVWTLTGDNTWSGGLKITGGTVLANNRFGSATGSGPVNVSSGGTLGGTGQVEGAVTVQSGGAIAPGNGVGSLNIDDRLTMNTGSELQVEIGSSADLLSVSGALVLNATVNVIAVDGIAPGVFEIIDYDSSRSGTPSIGTVPAGFSATIDLSVAGKVRLVIESTEPPSFDAPVIDGSNLMLSGGGGQPGASFSIVTTVDVSLPLGEWIVLEPGQFDAEGQFAINVMLGDAPGGFYALRIEE